ncbi:HAMP domain-containing histidine kinase [Pseudoalteromonas luteoviolacea]|uniref:sensor histidine kinase n=1 Tax=Pseudoalteromonas luteoviolacea TaxID=43657 RepID=UPI001F31705B|nr:HAMP domain-containing sensor histidine kinase [Pseudoalteromonas luteoviolacea]MCF6443012.1 HAMP domain-containing histidine kinase [Pseudoalteromonas luteoviolacea]
MTILLALMLPSILALHKVYGLVISCLDGISVQIDSLANEDFTIWRLANYQQGRVAQIKAELKSIACRMQYKRQEYAENESFIFDFINELDLPIVVLDHHFQVYHYNIAAAHFYKGVHITGFNTAQLALEKINGRWQTISDNQRFKVLEHTLFRGQRQYKLMVYVSIEQQLRKNEQQVWQKLVRVLNHEVRNSLTPIYSMAQSLKDLSSNTINDLQQTMLGVIEKRAEHLLGFVSSYSKLSQLPEPKMHFIAAFELQQRLHALFPDVTIKQLSGENLNVYCDLEQLEQVLLNLVKNANEANEITGADEIIIVIKLSELHSCFEVIDYGEGVSNTDNLFTPFYSTKEQGSGIGLVLSREIIRAQGGELTLKSRGNSNGAIATIQLPNLSKDPDSASSS